MSSLKRQESDMIEASQPEKPKRASGRSPNYPGISLSVAIDRARTVWEREKRNSAPVRVLMKHWGYTNPTGGSAGVTFGALKKFGLVEDEGSGADRPAKLTDLAFEILNNPDPSAAIKKAALLPPLHAEMWASHGVELPSGDTLKWQLMQRGFTESGANEFIREYRETIAFAKLAEDGSKGDQDETSDRDKGADTTRRNEDSSSGGRGNGNGRGGGVNGKTLTIPVPVIGGAPVLIEGEFPITEAAWNQFMAVLNAMKPGLVSQPVGDEPAE
jgi:hypothetical protein